MHLGLARWSGVMGLLGFWVFLHICNYFRGPLGGIMDQPEKKAGANNGT